MENSTELPGKTEDYRQFNQRNIVYCRSFIIRNAEMTPHMDMIAHDREEYYQTNPPRTGQLK